MQSLTWIFKHDARENLTARLYGPVVTPSLHSDTGCNYNTKYEHVHSPFFRSLPSVPPTILPPPPLKTRLFYFTYHLVDRNTNHLSRVEVRVYVQKVKHLEYEHQNNLKSITMDGEYLLGGEDDLHG